MKIKRVIVLVSLVLTIALAMASCNKITDLQPVDADQLPDSVANILTSKFPDARDAVFKTVEKDKLWEVTYTENGNTYYSALDAKKILATYQIHSSTVPDTLVQIVSKLSVGGGAFQDLKSFKDSTQGYVTYCSRYTFDNNDFFISWSLGGDSRGISLEPYFKFSFQVENGGEIPENILNYLQADGKKFLNATIRIDDNNRKSYVVKTDWGTYKFDGKGTPISPIGSPFAIYLTEKEFPSAIQDFISKSYLQSFQVKYLYQYRKLGADIYDLDLLKQEVRKTESYTLNFGNAGNLTWLSYYGTYKL